MTNNPVEDDLANLDLPELDPALRERLFAATRTQIRRRRQRRTGGQLAALVAAFTAGALLTSGRGTTHNPVDVATANSAEQAPEQAPSSVPLFADPEALAFAYDATDDAGKLRLLKEAGDYELNVNQDIRAALDYYRQWIRLADAATRKAYDETDTWLLASLKYTP